MKKSVRNEVHVKEQLDDLDDYRPFFTYWVTTVQVIVLIISLFSYGFGPAGIDLNRRSGLVSSRHKTRSSVGGVNFTRIGCGRARFLIDIKCAFFRFS